MLHDDGDEEDLEEDEVSSLVTPPSYGDEEDLEEEEVSSVVITP